MNEIMQRTKIDTDLDLLFRYFNDEDNSVTLTQTLLDRANRIRFIMMLYFDNDLGQNWEIPTSYEVFRKIKHDFPGVSFPTIRKDIEYLKRIHPSIDKVDVEFERRLLLRSIKHNVNEARKKGNLKVVAAEHRNWSEVARVNKDVATGGDNVLNINIINFNPSQIGATEVPNIDALIEKYIQKDKDTEREIIEIQAEVIKNE